MFNVGRNWKRGMVTLLEWSKIKEEMVIVNNCYRANIMNRVENHDHEYFICDK